MQLPIPHQEVSGGNVAMHPHRITLPARLQGYAPSCQRRAMVNEAPTPLQQALGLGLIVGKLASPVEVLRPRNGAVGGVDSVQRGQKARQPTCKFTQIADVRPRGRFAGNPAVQRPMPRVAGAGCAQTDRLRYLQRQMTGKPRQPLEFGQQMGSVAAGARQASAQGAADPERAIVVATRSNR